MDRDLSRQIAAFEAARIAHPLHLEPAPVQEVLAVHDGTDQDRTVTALAEAAAAKTGAKLKRLAADGDEPHAAILEAAKSSQLMFIPSPFRLDYAEHRAQSLSTTIDLVLARGRTPVCLVRGPVEEPVACLSNPIVALNINRHRKVDATCLALTLARDGTIALLSVVDPQKPVHEAELLGRYLDPGDLSPDVLEGLATSRAAALTSALQKGANEWSVTPRVKFILGDVVETALEVAEGRGGLLVAGLARDGHLDEAQRARQLVLGSSLPVLLV